mmetsp:Transcript_6973/g.8788  ORF Transcript_6973/g.8788 Transcript_6973/m.8788 type:complete len:240 (-) Transcript_6973:156-875(-)
MERFTRLASRQQQSFNTSRRDSDGGQKITKVNALAIALFVLFVLLVFGGIIALQLYCIYLGVEVFVNNDTATSNGTCLDFDTLNNKLAGWLIAHGVLGLVSTSLLIVTAIPDKKEISEDVESQRIRHSLLVVPLGVSELLHLIWFLVGTYWIKDILKLREMGCTSYASWFSFLYIVTLWGVISLICFIACCYVFIRGAVARRDFALSDDNREWRHMISLSELGGGGTSTRDEEVKVANT